MSDVEPDEATAVRDHDRARLRWPNRIVAVGSVLALLVAFMTSAGAQDGALGALLFLLLLALVLGAAGVLCGAQLLLDEIKGRPTSLRRGVMTGGLLVVSLVCIVGSGGIATSLST